MKPFTGIFTPIVTPFKDDELDETGLAGNVAKWMGTPLAGLVVLGSNGEAPQLEEAEADRVIAVAREGVPRDRILIAGTGRESTRGAIAATKRAAALGVDAVLVRTPCFFKQQMTADVFVRHYTEVADASPVPVLLYNVTMFTGVTLQADAVAALATHPNIAGMKESGGDLALIAEYIGRTPDDFSVLAGSASTFFHALCAGCSGGVLALSGILTDDCLELRELVKQGRLEEGRALQQRMLPLARAVGAQHGVPGLKAALDLLGFTGGAPRPPLQRSPTAVVNVIQTQLEEAGRLKVAATH